MGEFKPVWSFDEQVPVQATHLPSNAPKAIAEEAYIEYRDQGHGAQSFERLHERGGFGWQEMAILLYNRIKRLSSEDSGR